MQSIEDWWPLIFLKYGRAIRHKTAYTYNQSYMVWLYSGLVEEQPRKPYTQGATQSYIPQSGI
jgi:hypothetical protein